MRLRVRNLTCQCDNDDFYNPIDLNHIFNDDDILVKLIREGELILPPDDLGWLDEDIRRSNESVGDGGDNDHDSDGGDDNDGDGDADEGTYGVGGSQQGGTMS